MRAKGSKVKRSYDGARRRDAAAQTRAAILETATRLFIANGYAGTTMADIANEAGIALDTIYAAVGAKHVLFRTLIETAISGTDRAVPAEDRDYVRAIHAEPDAGGKLKVYAGALRRIHERLAPLTRVLEEAARGEKELAAVWTSIAERRLQNMRRFAAELHATGDLRVDMEIDEIADVIWATNAPALYLLLVRERKWSPERFEVWLADTWVRLLLRTEAQARHGR